MRILLVEDDEDLAAGVVEALEAEGHQVACESEGREGAYQALEWEWDLIILDRMLPGEDGVSILRKVRGVKAVPILMLTALNRAEDRVEGLDSGADDYLGKPFEISELKARVNALARRAYHLRDREVRLGCLSMNLDRRQVYANGESLELTPLEFRIFECLVLRKGRSVSRRVIEDLVAEEGGDIQPGTLDVRMHRLRKKLGADVIRTERGRGYRVTDDSERA